MWTSDLLPFTIDPNLRPYTTCCILDDFKFVCTSDSHNAFHIAWHADLMDAHDGLGARRDRCLDLVRIQIERSRIDIDEDRDRSTLTDCVRRGDESMAGHDDLIAGFYTYREETEMKSNGAIGNGASVLRTNSSSKFLLEGSNLG